MLDWCNSIPGLLLAALLCGLTLLGLMDRIPIADTVVFLYGLTQNSRSKQK